MFPTGRPPIIFSATGVAIAALASVGLAYGPEEAPSTTETDRVVVAASAPLTAPEARIDVQTPPPPHVEFVPEVIAEPNPVTTTSPGPAAPPTSRDPIGPITSPDVGDHCADGLDADQLSAFFAEPIGAFEGGDYQRALRLADDRVLWTFQDAFVDGTLVHNVGMIQSGRCFTLLNSGPQSWLLGDETSHMHRWHWILDGVQEPDGRIHLFVVEMQEQGGGYLDRTTPISVRRVVLDGATLTVVDVVLEEPTGIDLYGWSITTDDDHTYLYSHCYRQFGFDGVFGGDDCAAYVRLARTAVGAIGGPREYWDGNGWSADHRDAVAVVDGSFVIAGNNPAQVVFDGSRFLLVEKRDDWWGATIEFGVATTPMGPFRHIDSVDQPLKCPSDRCNTYFATWVPWTDADGGLIWSIGHNRWNGAETASHLHVYRPTFHPIDL